MKRVIAYIIKIGNPWEHQVLKWIPTVIAIAALVVSIIVGLTR